MIYAYIYSVVVYATPAVIDAVKKGQQENAANILSRALHMCKEKKVLLIIHIIISTYI